MRDESSDAVTDKKDATYSPVTLQKKKNIKPVQVS